MSRVCAREASLAGRWYGSNVSADIERRQANAAHRRDHNMGEILANASSTIKGLGRWRPDVSRFWVINEVGMNAPRQLVRRGKDRPLRDETLFGVGSRFVKKRNAAGRIEGDCRAVCTTKRRRCDRLGRNVLPSWTSQR